jgi:hypothetical protein
MARNGNAVGATHTEAVHRNANAIKHTACARRSGTQQTAVCLTWLKMSYGREIIGVPDRRIARVALRTK